MRELLEDAAQRAIAYLENLGARQVAPLPDSVAKLPALDQPLPEKPHSPETVLQRLDEMCSGATMAMAGPRFFGFVIGGALPAALAANWLAAAWDQNSVLYNATPGTAYLEQV
ncbi:MAG: aspartate aminotransferase family protein, partial [Gammaproteobacteria bacterium]|nr:aspartate aminotransferase family protein [Gammaproteobacteria bacterium]